jgi:hypothetical protein
MVVCVIATVAPSSSSSADGEPGSRSTKKLPSSRIRGRTSSWASSWIGRASSLSSMVTRAAPSTDSTPVTLPTSTPATRTGAPDLRFLASRNMARSS